MAVLVLQVVEAVAGFFNLLVILLAEDHIPEPQDALALQQAYHHATAQIMENFTQTLDMEQKVALYVVAIVLAQPLLAPHRAQED